MLTLAQYTQITAFLDRAVVLTQPHDVTVNIAENRDGQVFQIIVNAYQFRSMYRPWADFPRYMQFILDKLESGNFFGLIPQSPRLFASQPSTDVCVAGPVEYDQKEIY